MRCVVSVPMRTRRHLVQEVRLVFPAARVLQVHAELVAGRAELLLEIEVDVGEAGVFLFPPEPEPLALAGRDEDERHLRDVDVPLEVVDARHRHGRGVVQLQVGAEPDGVVILLAVLGHLRLDHAAVVVEARRELVVRQIVLQQHLALDEGARPLGAVVQVDARDDLFVVREAAEVGRQIGALLGELADAEADADVARQPELLFLLVDDVDDAGHARRIEPRRRDC